MTETPAPDNLSGQSTEKGLAELKAIVTEGIKAKEREAEHRECMEVRRLLGYLWNATGKNHLRPVHDLFAEDDPIVADVERLAIFDRASDD